MESLVRTVRFATGLVLLAIAFAAGWVGGACSTSSVRAAPTPKWTQPVPEKQVAQVPEAREVGSAFAAVAARLAPAVVRVTMERRAAHPSSRDETPGSNPFEGTPFERFFEDFGLRPPSDVPMTGTGSGVVIDTQGHILTNHHVVAKAEELRVSFVDGKEVEAKVVGTDPKTDLAVIKVDVPTPNAAAFGDAQRMRAGEWVMAIGNPFGLDHSVTVGVLSAKGRYGFAPGKLEDFLQTDASINPGNSGGPLVNLNGEIIGINTMIAGIGTGVGFAVSESMARPIAKQLIEHGKVTRPYIGITMQPLTPAIQRALGDKAPDKGALVSSVQRGSPAERAGIQVGDIVVRVGEQATADSREVQQAVLALQVGQKVEVGVWRNGETKRVTVQTAELPAEAGAPASSERGEGGQLGLELQTLTPELAARRGLDRNQKGAAVTGVRPGSPAAEAGLQVGDVLLGVDGGPVSTGEQAVQRLGKERKGGHLVHVQRGELSLFVAIEDQGGE